MTSFISAPSACCGKATAAGASPGGHRAEQRIVQSLMESLGARVVELGLVAWSPEESTKKADQERRDMARMSAGKKVGVGLLVCLGLFVCVGGGLRRLRHIRWHDLDGPPTCSVGE